MLKGITYTIMFSMALTIYIRQRLDLPLYLPINNYFNDFVCLPLVLVLLRFFIRYVKKDKDFQFSLLFVLLLASYYSFFFEWYLPELNSRYTADWIDVGLYFTSGILFFMVENSNRRKRSV